jgi:hypothetical protein
VLHQDSTSLGLRVFDRVAGGEVLHDGRGQPLSSTRPASRTLELRVVSGRWVVESVSDSG